MKKSILFILGVFFALTSMAQVTQRKRFSPEEYKHRMEFFIAKEACLTQSEAQKFFPLLHEMLEKQRENNRKTHEIMRKGFKAKTESEYQNVVDEAITLEIENKKIEKNYYKKFHTVLSWEKIHKVRIALYKFNFEALKKFTPHRPQKK